jgi:hypothetical protein
MRFHSTPESALNGEMTKLAIVECIVAVAFYVAVGFSLGTFRLIAVAVALAPLTLFRTETSARWGLKQYERAGQLLEFDGYWLFLSVPLTILAGSAIRVVATLYWALRKPLYTLREMPQNWLRQSFCTDLFCPPEIIPFETVYGSKKILRFGDFVGSFGRTHWRTAPQLITLALLFGPGALVGYLPPMFYRISFKATSIAYAPFVWVAHSTLGSPESVKLRLERITKGELEKARRWLSGLVAASVAAKIALASGWVDISEVIAKFPSQKFVKTILVTQAWPWWQITLATDALLTFLLLYYADAALARLETKDAWSEKRTDLTLSTVIFIRACLALITISYFFYLALSAALVGHSLHVWGGAK